MRQKREVRLLELCARNDACWIGRHTRAGAVGIATPGTAKISPAAARIPVGRKLPNPWGLFDVHGNAWEWVQDRYSDSYYAESPSTDPQGPAGGRQRVVRGGSWHVTSTSWRSSFRKPYPPDYRGISIGFRLAMTAE